MGGLSGELRTELVEEVKSGRLLAVLSDAESGSLSPTASGGSPWGLSGQRTPFPPRHSSQGRGSSPSQGPSPACSDSCTLPLIPSTPPCTSASCRTCVGAMRQARTCWAPCGGSSATARVIGGPRGTAAAPAGQDRGRHAGPRRSSAQGAAAAEHQRAPEQAAVQ
ncbi:rootletin-like [Pongo abelii]|uniref:rootletin-like n=1 Tax=Pongo abelii TaxID=9601 RepID=UPI0030051150